MPEPILQVLAFPFWFVGQGCAEVLTMLKRRAGHDGVICLAWRPSSTEGERDAS